MKTIMVLVLLAVSSPFWAASQDVQQFSIRFFDQKVYFLGDEIQVEAVITNTGTDTLRFKVADNRFFNLDFDVRTPTNVGLEHAKEFTIARNSDQPVFYREVALEPGEKYGIVVDLATYAAFTSPGQFVLQATFYPDLFHGPGSPTMKSNRLSLNIKPPVVTAEEKAVVEAETGALLARQPLPPDEVVSWTITARQKSQWEKFFLYLDLEALMRKNPAKDRVFRNSTEAQQRQMLAQFRTQLMQTTIQQDISVIPSSFEIQKTTYNATEGTVQALERFAYPDYTELRGYTYHLKKSDRYWIIYDYEIKNMGTQ
ncbi:MAG: hypothetical protein ABSG63_14350 [Spirochaetia bacterium]|jgi:FtsP/CotA-like multicopper oxidase with cupredoxin domain